MPGWKRDRPATGSGRARARRGARAAGAGSGAGRPARGGRGGGHRPRAVALVSGEAGIGKTSLVARVRASLAAGARVLRRRLRRPADPAPARPAARRGRGHAPARSRPRSPAPAGRRVRRGRGRAAPRAADRAGRRGPALGRRRHARRRWATSPAGSPTCPRVLVLTYRDDEAPPAHPVRRLLGALAGRPCAGWRCARCSARGGRRARRRAGLDAATRCTRSPAATRSTSPRRSPRRARPCRPPSPTPCWRG